MARGHGDGGFSLIELLLVIVILGMLATILVFTVGGMSADAQGVGCHADQRAPVNASEAYLAHRGGGVIPAADAGGPAVENTLVAEGFLQTPSEWYDLDADGHLLGSTGSPCTI